VACTRSKTSLEVGLCERLFVAAKVEEDENLEKAA